MHYNDDRPDSLSAHYCAGDLKMTIINYSVIINIYETRFLTTLLSIQNHNFGIKSFFAIVCWGGDGGGWGVAVWYFYKFIETNPNKKYH